MKRKSNSKITTIVVLLIGVIALSIGFSAFTRDLDIIFDTTTVDPGDLPLNVKFTAGQADDGTTTVTPTVSGATGNTATIDNDSATNPLIRNLGANFTNKGQSVTYTFYVYNDSEYIAYLKKATFSNYTGKSTNKVCTPGTNTTASLVTAACNDISLSVQVAGNTLTETKTGGFTTPSIEPTTFSKVIVTIAYNNSTNPIPDGDFSVNFGNVVLSYSSLAG